MNRRNRTRIGPRDPGGPLLDYLTARFTYHGRSAWEALTREGRLLVNDRPATGKTVLAPGDVLEFRAPEDEPEPPVNPRFTVLFEDDAILAVDKPPDLPCHPGGRYFRNTLWALLQEQRPGEPPPRLVNRLDRETSGVVLAAKNTWAARSVGRQLQQKQMWKRYLALVEGAFPRTVVEARGFLTSDPKRRVRKRRTYRPGPLSTEDAEACHTTLRGIETVQGVSLVEALPRTGRLHQIRATLHGLGYPVVGDKLYGPDETLFLRFIQGRLTEEDRRRLRLPRQALHAAGVRIHHPAHGRPLQLTSPLPPDLRAFLDEVAGRPA